MAEFKYKKTRSIPLAMLLAAGAIGYYLSLPISGLGQDNISSNLVPPEKITPRQTVSDREVQRLKAEIQKEREKTDSYQTELSEEKKYSQFLIGEIQKNKTLAGLTPMRGPGIIIRLSESTGSIEPNYAPGSFLIHQEDLLNILNELWHNDAEAIAVGGSSGRFERITTFSPLRCSGGAIEVNDQRMVPPFEIRAIGKPDLLKSVLEMRGGYLEKLLAYQISATVQISDMVEIPAYSGSTLNLYGHGVVGTKEILPEGEEGR